MNSLEIIKRAKRKPKRVKVTFSLDILAHEEFKKKCEKNNVIASRVIDTLIKEFLK